jgi:hypothetical protein
MRRSLWIAIILASPGLAAYAGAARAGEGMDLSQKSKLMAAAPVPKQVEAPFTSAHLGRDPLPELVMREEAERRGPKGACDNSTNDLCYDLADRRVVYRPVRQYMPRVEGLSPDSVSLRRDKLVFKYTFR